jgi:uncharacterized protein HemY
MIDSTVDSGKLIEFSDRISPLVRVLIFVFGLIPLYAPYDLLLPFSRWNSFSIFLIGAVAISLGATVVSLLFMAAALFGISSTVRFDGASRIVTYSWETAVTGLRVHQHSFEDIERLAIETREWSEGPAMHRIVADLKAGRSFEFGKFNVRAEAERYLEKLRKMI